MSTNSRAVICALGLFLFSACSPTEASESNAQAVVDAIAAKNESILRLTIHAMPAGETEYVFAASTLASKIGQPSDPEDLQAIETGEVVVLEETGGIDVTVPIRLREGKHTAAAGVTMDASMGQEAAVKAATAIAAEIDRDWTSAGS